MRIRFLLAFQLPIVLAALLGLPQAGAEEGLVDPYVVFTAHEKVYARCGPAGEYYRTDPLRLGQELDVYLETDDGWLGIRPPEGSFSWVPASSIDADPAGRSGIVVDRRAVAWIGTHLGRARKYRWQVQLAEGEQVTILGQTERNSGEGPELWYRIVPPSGEFRWVHRSQIAESSEELVQMHRQIDSDRNAERRSRDADQPQKLSSRELESFADAPLVVAADAELDAADQPYAEQANAARNPFEDQRRSDAVANQTTQTPRSSPSATASEAVEPTEDMEDQPVGSGVARTSFVEPEMSVESSVQLRDIESGRKAVPPAQDLAADDSSWVTGNREPAVRQVAASGPAIRNASTRGTLQETTPPVLKSVDQLTPLQQQQQARQLSQRVVNADIDELQLELSRQMAAGASAAMVEPIRRRAQMWIEQLSDPLDRERARVLIERVEQYQRVSRRRDGQPPLVPGATSLPTVTPASAAVPNARPFDREGYLVQVYSARPDSPSFALNNGAGQTLAYVSPAPGVNLRQHLNAKVGLQGEMSYLTGLETPHFIAKRVVRISR
ncbi:SH3 domain-containing protein [Roseimaritima ulvae]|uniref:Bacterial SH3 domain protein n=1 Tax=Roseimaritima ulvae TaxID=980254 RepID=A0A5B9QNR4_9BACT|nr:hypothetical protein [Roseimaritima ulvae]QEG40747.1 hypothetical protein UC8_27640 [Roseimaritima ulvae]